MLKHLVKLMGGKDYIMNSSLGDYNGAARFNNGECRYFMGFTESLRFLDKGDYAIEPVNFSEYEKDQIPLFLTDYISMGNHVHQEKMLDCLDLMEIISSEDFLYELCVENGNLQYMLPANRKVYSRLAEKDPIYNRFYEMVSNEDNCVFRYGAHFYESFNKTNDELIQWLLNEMD